MNIKLLFVFAFPFAFTFVGCQSTQTEEKIVETQETPATDPWDQAMDAYHDVMSVTFHPAEEGNLAPLKERHKELADLSQSWGQVEVPEKFQGRDLENMLEELKSQSVALSEMVEGGSTDEDLTEAITALHDVFHNIMGACKHGKEHGKHQH
ncbi:MAG: hypothetical protein RJA52_615 [Bacteroidota bacterium]|jgi:hypothetical protein